MNEDATAMVDRDLMMVFKRWPEGMAAMHALNDTLSASGLSRELLELVRIRVSLLNACAFCIDLHTTVALNLGVPAAKLDALATWSDDGTFTPAERAALLFTDALTRPQDELDERIRSELDSFYTQKQITQLGFAIGVINAWNRIAITDQALTPRNRISGVSRES